MRIPLFHVDAFTSHSFHGNPAAVCLLDFWLDDEFMLKVAAENNVSATAFVVSAGNKDDKTYEIRWFNSRLEIQLCGHATLASAWVLLDLIKPGWDCVRFRTRSSGTLSVSKSEGLLQMDFPALAARPCAAPEELIRGLGHSPQEILEANNRYLAVFQTEQDIRDLRPNLAVLEGL